jgi:dipeptidyl aminopeptidase/acylaminoacyl peptidase
MKRRSSWLGLAMLLAAFAPVRGQEPTIPVPETIRVQDVPPIPASVRQALKRYQNQHAASFADWASNGSGMYVIARSGEVPQVYFLAQAGGRRTQLTSHPERISGVSARPGHDQFLYASDEGGSENYQFFLQDRRGREARRITDGKSRNSGPKWSPSGRFLAWSSDARNGRDMDLYLASTLEHPSVRRLKDVSGQWWACDWSPDETRLVAIETVPFRDGHTRIIEIVEIATGKAQTLPPRPSNHRPEQVSSAAARWSKDGAAIYYITDTGSEFRRLVRYELASGRIRTLTTGIPWDIEDFDLSEDGRFVALVANENGISKIHLLNAKTGANAALLPPRLPAGQVARLAFRPGAREVAFTSSSSQSPSNIFVYTGFSGPTRRWTGSEAVGPEPKTFAEPELIAYSSFDGQKIPAFVYRPSARRFPGPRPVLIEIHGGPSANFRPGFLGRYNYLIDELGLVLIFPNVRGSLGYGKTYLNLDNGKHRGDAVKDIGALLDWIAGQPDLDSSRVGVSGGSYGGFMSLAVQANYNDRIKCGIDVAGISNIVTLLRSHQGHPRDSSRAEFGDERDPEMRAYLEKVSPLSGAERIRTPSLIVQGQNDPRVPISEAEQMVAAVRKNGMPVWYVVGTNEGHGFARKANQDFLQAVEVEFLRRYLLGPDRK